jgi:hypothetical protein
MTKIQTLTWALLTAVGGAGGIFAGMALSKALQ